MEDFLFFTECTQKQRSIRTGEAKRNQTVLQVQFFRYFGNTVCSLLVTAVHSKFLQAESSIKIWLFHFLVWEQVLIRLELLLRLLDLFLWQTLNSEEKINSWNPHHMWVKNRETWLSQTDCFSSDTLRKYSMTRSSLHTSLFVPTHWGSAFCMSMQKNWTLKVRCILTWVSNAARNKLYCSVWLYNCLVCCYSCLGAITHVHAGSSSGTAGCACTCVCLLLIHNMSVRT